MEQLKSAVGKDGSEIEERCRIAGGVLQRIRGFADQAYSAEMAIFYPLIELVIGLFDDMKILKKRS